MSEEEVKLMRYFLASFAIFDGEHEHRTAAIIEANTSAEACKRAEAEEFNPETDNEKFYFSFGGDGMVGCKNTGCQEITKEQMCFLEQVGLAYRM
jgi:hypothetical protein